MGLIIIYVRSLPVLDAKSPDISQGVTEGEGLHKGARRRRSGYDVWLCVQRHAGIDAASYYAGSPDYYKTCRVKTKWNIENIYVLMQKITGNRRI